jgi:hypothetical protein
MIQTSALRQQALNVFPDFRVSHDVAQFTQTL